jgi:monoamine oxidase
MWTDGIAGLVYEVNHANDCADVIALSTWTVGSKAHYLNSVDHAQAANIVVSELHRMRPAARGTLQVTHVQSWALDPYAGVACSISQSGRLVAAVSDKAAHCDRLFFCGEHVAVARRGMEGALESSGRVAHEIQLALSQSGFLS